MQPKSPGEVTSQEKKPRLFFHTENAQWLKDKIKLQPVSNGKDVQITEVRRQTLLELSMFLPELSELVIENYVKFAKEKGFDPGKVCMYLVGGRVRNEPIKDTSDFDFSITCENPLLNPANKSKEAISFPIRQEIHKSLNSLVRELLQEKGFGDNEDLGLVEIKGLGNINEVEAASEEETVTPEEGKEAIKIAEFE